MRAYALFRGTFYTRGSGKKLRGNKEAQILVQYLLTCQQGTLCGLFYIGIPTIAYETGLSTDEVCAALELEAVREIIRYDHEEDLCWVPNCAAEQIGEKLNGKDNRRKKLEQEIRQFGNHPFVHEFIDRYSAKYDMEMPTISRPLEAPSKGQSDVEEAPSKGDGRTGEAPSSAQLSIRSDQIGGLGDSGDVARFEASFTAPTRAATSWPDNFKPSPENVEQAKRAGLDLNEEIVACRNNARTKSRTSCDWNSDLSTWMLRSVKFRKKEGEEEASRPRKGRVPQGNHGKTGTERAVKF